MIETRGARYAALIAFGSWCVACGGEGAADRAPGGGAGGGDGSVSGGSAGATAGSGGVAGAAATGGAAGSAGAAGQPDGGLGGAPAHDGGLGDADVDATTECTTPTSRFVTGVVDHRFGAGQSTGQDQFPEILYGPPRGGGCCQGALDVVSLGDEGFVTVEFAGNAIIDGPGADFIVFENAFNAGGDLTQPFAERGAVEVSQDGTSWVAFPCTATSYPYGTCAGWHPVFANADTNSIDPTDPDVAGGDPFDLADIGVPTARYVRVTDVHDAQVFDLDAVAIVNAKCP